MRAYDKKVRLCEFREEELVLKKILPNQYDPCRHLFLNFN